MNDTQTGSAPVPATPALSDQPLTLTPRPTPNWGKWAAEIGVVVVGVLLALGAQQTVEAMNWDEKVNVLEGAIRAELSNDLGLATELKLLHPCVTSYLDTLQAAVVDGDGQRIAKLNELGAPIFGRAWPRDTWSAALNGEIANHLPETRVTAYSRAFLRIGVQREFMQQMEDLYPVALSGGFGLPRDIGVTHEQLVAIQRLRGLEARRILIANSLLEEDGPAVSVTPSERYLAEDQAFVQKCDTGLAAIRAPAP